MSEDIRDGSNECCACASDSVLIVGITREMRILCAHSPLPHFVEKISRVIHLFAGHVSPETVCSVNAKESSAIFAQGIPEEPERDRTRNCTSLDMPCNCCEQEPDDDRAHEWPYHLDD